ncbi:agmatinase [Muricauda oceani]|uniref:Agmatinase n=1 Tax=Flagellimonas oceani TaxID=2698672 RepID=A0A6G7J2W1_9FLAO|nr:agmatinase [Allomuricauda oceani]MBW8243970.1 agmatinase [Allomuricauda oceani]QII44949.1 agmatinase [Allomuricauda oceani]
MKTERTYAGIPKEYGSAEKAKVVLLPVPYDGTSTWGKGADKGPEAFLEASENMEIYDIETDSEVYKQGIYLADTLENFETPDAMVETVHKTVKDYIKRGKLVTMVGGEHSISIGAIRAFSECVEDLTVLQIDAHADLRKEYGGTKYNHACAMYEAKETTNLVQVGIRSMDYTETLVMDRDNVFFAHEMISEDFWMDSALDLMTDNVYITFDLDAFDPSILPSTGTPEPGGLFWYETLDFLKRVFKEKNVVGLDIVELCPNDIDRSSDFLAAKLYYKMLSYKFSNNNEYMDENFEDDDDFKKSKNNLEDYDE